MRRASRLSWGLGTSLLLVGGALGQPTPAQGRAETIRRYAAPEARQAVAVDAAHFYAITNREIGKYARATGERVAHWRGEAEGPFVHLNSGVVIDQRLYCAHSNYPGLPMVSSIEVFDTNELRHLESIPLGLGHGSATWVDRHEDAWWVAFANYAGRGGEPGRGPEYTVLVRYDDAWRQTGAWAFPPDVVARWDGMSTSGGYWRPSDGLLYTAPHHAPELQVLRLPAAGARLSLVRTLPIESEGQGIAADPTDDTLVWSIQRKTGEVLVSRLP
jgi:hypothetical protein